VPRDAVVLVDLIERTGCIELLSKSPSASPDATGTLAVAGTRVSTVPAAGTDAATRTVPSEAKTKKKTVAVEAPIGDVDVDSDGDSGGDG
jgi:hypothetical protein